MKQLFVLLLSVLFLTACAPPMAEESFDVVLATRDSASAAAVDAPPLLDLLGTEPDLVLFLSALNSTGLMTQLQSGGPYTIFAPSNAAFTKLRMATTEIDPALLREVIAYHVAFGQIASAELQGSTESLAAQPLTFVQVGDALLIDGYATITGPDVPIAEGVVHVIDSLLLPPEVGAEKSMWGLLAGDGRFNTLSDLLAGSDTMYQLRFATIDAFLAPTDDAFASLNSDMLDRLFTDDALRDLIFNKYYLLSPDGWPTGQPLLAADIAQMDNIPTHIGRYGYRSEAISVSGEGDALRIGGAHVVIPDMLATNGVVHGLDTAIMPQAATAGQ
ncbi:MAG: fasciclin domain-containing protein [Chloroflexota bacterium]|nr:fasciclin domain-containing protein [Ardenticatenaceae bacterium]